MTKIMIAATMMPANTSTKTGYIMAAFTSPVKLRGLLDVLREALSRFVSRIRCLSGRDHVTKQPVKRLGCLRMASANVAPDSTSDRVARMTAAKFLSSS